MYGLMYVSRYARMYVCSSYNTMYVGRKGIDSLLSNGEVGKYRLVDVRGGQTHGSDTQRVRGSDFSYLVSEPEETKHDDRFRRR